MECLRSTIASVVEIDEKCLQIVGASAVGFLGIVYLIRKYVQRTKYTKTNRIDGQVVIITGANTGLGKAAALELARRGAKLYLACRDMNKCAAVQKEIIELTNNKNVFAWELDLGSLDSVRKFVDSFCKVETKLDILMNNAGVFMAPKTITKDGLEQIMGVNHLGHFLLTNLLLDLLKKSSPSRVVVVSSTSHKTGVINKEDLMMLTTPYSKYSAYSNSKLANNLFTIHLAKLLERTGVTVNSLCPGMVKTDAVRHFNSILRSIIYVPLVSLFGKTTENGAQTQIQLAIDPDLEKVTGKYFAHCAEAKPAKQALDYEMAEWLWNKSVELTGLKKM